MEWFDAGTDSPLADRFVAAGAALQATCPGRLVADLRTALKRLSPDFAFYRYGTGRCFMAYDGDQPLGRCIATLNHRANDDSDSIVGHIGMWECVDDDEVASELLTAATRYLDSAGCHEIVGPLDFSTWYPYRNSIGPHDGSPLLLEPYTPAHYDRQWRGAGFEVANTYFTSRIDDPAIAVERAQERIAAAESAGFTMHCLRMDRFSQTLDELYDLSIVEFAQAPHFSHIDRQEFRSLYDGAARGLDPRLVLLAIAPSGDLAGYAFCVPNHVQAVRMLDGGSAGMARRLRALLALRRADAALVKTLCVARRYRSYGLGTVLVARAHEAALELGYRRVYHMLMHEDNHSLKISERAGGEVARRYVLYRLLTARGREAAVRKSASTAQDRLRAEDPDS